MALGTLFDALLNTAQTLLMPSPPKSKPGKIIYWTIVSVVMIFIVWAIYLLLFKEEV